mmetsp:Transcript_11374/g.27774  ORF Transcript_11374/g.27774 Transcript_11374/m.27774 type:complete len:594 (-) Transcript_11374:870-2651(-)
MARPVDENDLTNAMDLLRQEMNAVQDKALKLVDKKMGGMITEKATSLMSDVMTSVDAKQQKMMKTIEAKFNSTEKAIGIKIKEGDDKLGDRVDDTNRELAATRSDLAKNVAELKNMMGELRQETQESLAEFKSSVDAALAAATQQGEDTASRLEEVNQILEDALAEMRKNHDIVNTRLDGLIMYQRQLEQDLFACENMAARRVEWEIADAKRLMLASRRIALASTTVQGVPRQSFFSPPFSAAGVRNLQIELAVKFKPAPTKSATTDVHIGEAHIYLWAPKGTHCWFRLYLNDTVKTFEGTYPSRQPVGGFFGDIDVPVKQPADDFKMLVTLEISESKVVQRHEIAPYVAVNAQDGISCSGNLYFSRHVNHRLLDQVKQQVEVIRSRMLKRVEWKVENASKLQEQFPAGNAMLSPYFAIAGIDRLRFQFFPSGYLDPDENPAAVKGFCSLFLHCPAGTTVNGVLTINMNGNVQKRPIEHFYPEAGSFGRTLFCRYAVIPGAHPEDFLVVSLDVNSAEQKLQSTNNDPDESGTLQVRRGVSDAADLSEVRVLPTLWTRYSQIGQKLPMRVEPDPPNPPPATKKKSRFSLLRRNK